MLKLFLRARTTMLPQSSKRKSSKSRNGVLLLFGLAILDQILEAWTHILAIPEFVELEAQYIQDIFDCVREEWFLFVALSHFRHLLSPLGLDTVGSRYLRKSIPVSKVSPYRVI